MRKDMTNSNFPLFEIVEELTWHLVKSLTSQLDWVVLELAERHKLYNVSLHILLEALRVKKVIVGVEGVHVAKVSIAYAYNND